MDFSQVVQEQMNRLNMRPSALARASGYSIQHICDLLSGNRRWNETTMAAVCSALNIHIHFTVDCHGKATPSDAPPQRRACR